MDAKVKSFIYKALVALVFVGLLLLRTGIVSPRIMLYVAIGLVSGLIILERFTKREYRELLFEPVTRKQVHSPGKYGGLIWKVFEEFTPAMLRLGMQFLGDYRLYREPLAGFARYFSSPDGKSFGEIHYANEILGYSFSSVFENGTFLESGPYDSKDPRPDGSDGFLHEFLPGASVEELYAHHMQTVRFLEPQLGPALVFAPEQFQQVSHYGNRLVNLKMYEDGRKSEPPPSLEPVSEPADEYVLAEAE